MNTTNLQRSTLASLAITVLSLFGSAFVVSAQDYSDWKYTHPLPQPNLIRKFQMIDANNWVGVGANGLFMRSTDAGATWYFHNQAGLTSNTALQIGNNTDVRFTSATTG